MDTQTDYIAALIDLHRGLPRLGPGDVDFSRNLLRGLPPLPPQPGIADLGCGSGAGALLLAGHYQCPVSAVDSSLVFIEELKTRAKQAGLGHLIRASVGDMAHLDWPTGSIDLLWCEGAAYNLGFEQSLSLWRPLLPPGGIAVLSELSWFTDPVPAPALAYWREAYPGIASEAENRARADRAGFEVLATQRLPASAWWLNYYGPLRERMAQFQNSPSLGAVMEAVIRDTEQEIDLFQQFSDCYGYTFYILRATPNGRAA